MPVPQDLRRIIALAPSITEMIYTPGCEDRLVGAARRSDYPAAAKSFPRVGTFVRPYIEKIVALGPDRCIHQAGRYAPKSVEKKMRN